MYLIIAIPLSILALILLNSPFQKKSFLIPYLFFFIGPTLTYFDIIGVLTGFNGDGFNGYTFGITFYTMYIAYQISKNKELIKINSLKFIVSVINPLYLFTGPVPVNSILNIKTLKLKRILKIFNVVNNDLIVGLFFSAILAPTLTPYFYLRNSTNIIDIFLFGFIFEIYVYFNFAGYSMIAWTLMRMIGIKAPRNFKQPFGSVSIIDYWQRWHISLSVVLKELFYTKTKPFIGMYGAVIFVFIASALWHGVTINFLLWGLFHAIFWCIAYYINKINFKILNYFILIIGIIVGRVIFSEIDTVKLMAKLSNIINLASWSYNSNYQFSNKGLREKVNLVLIFFTIGCEIMAPILGFSDKNYRYLKSPCISTLIAVYVCLAFVGFVGEPLYGNR